MRVLLESILMACRKRRPDFPSRLKRTRWTLFAALILSACAANTSWRYLPATPEEETTITVVSHGWHTGIAISKANLGNDLAFITAYLPAGDFFEFGWGDKAYYQAENPTLSMVLKTLLQPTESVLHVAALPNDPSVYFSALRRVKLTLSRQAHAKMNEAIAQAFQRKSDGEVIALQSGLYGDSLFFEGSEKYQFTHNCNVWIAKILAKGGVPVHSRLVLTADELMDQLEEARVAVDDLIVLKTAVLLEPGVLINPLDELQLQSKSTQQRIANAVEIGLKKCGSNCERP